MLRWYNRFAVDLVTNVETASSLINSTIAPLGLGPATTPLYKGPRRSHKCL